MALVSTAFMKNHMALLHLSFVAALILSGGLGLPLGKVVAHAFVSGIGSLMIFFGLLWAGGISLDRYLAVVVNLATFKDPVEARLLSFALEAGLFLLCLPLACLSPRKAEARFFAIWFALTTIPVLLSNRVEERYLVCNFTALTGLLCLSVEVLASFARHWWARHPSVTVATVTFISVAFVGTTSIAQLVMFHDLRIDQFRTVLRHLDQAYSREGYVILTPDEYTDFHYLRFAHPERQIYTVFTPTPFSHRDAKAWHEFQKRHYGSRAVQSFDELAALNTKLVYLGSESNFTVSNLQWLASTMPAPLGRFIDELITEMNPNNHLASSWMWNHPRIKLSEDFRHGHYVAMQVDIMLAPGLQDSSALQ